jgi:hypothetical protein
VRRWRLLEGGSKLRRRTLEEEAGSYAGKNGRKWLSIRSRREIAGDNANRERQLRSLIPDPEDNQILGQCPDPLAKSSCLMVCEFLEISSYRAEAVTEAISILRYCSLSPLTHVEGQSYNGSRVRGRRI